MSKLSAEAEFLKATLLEMLIKGMHINPLARQYSGPLVDRYVSEIMTFYQEREDQKGSDQK